MRRTAGMAAMALLLAACSGGGATSDGSPTPTAVASTLAPSASPSPSPSPSRSPTPSPTPDPKPEPQPEPEPTTAPATAPEPEPEPVRLRYVVAGSGFNAPLQVLPSPSGRTLVVEQDGRIRDLDSKAVFVDVRNRVDFGGEKGLLGAAFSGDGSRLYVHYSDDSGGDTAVAICPVSGNSASCPAPALEIDQPAGNHNGGSILWGPDGNVWLALGDGGGANNQYGNAENTSTPLGAILRLDPNTLAAASGNPGFGDNRIVHYGLRNPF
ncbi:MAG TPA: PQQ-dependent sugar dehydrogenase, partial [Nitriliruptorales bacterium]